MIIKGYIYKITINNPQSKLHKKTYVGQHKFKKSQWVTSEKNILNDGYWGSGVILKRYYSEWGMGYKVKKELVELIYRWNDIDLIESKHIKKDKTKLLFFKNKNNINIKD